MPEWDTVSNIRITQNSGETMGLESVGQLGYVDFRPSIDITTLCIWSRLARTPPAPGLSFLAIAKERVHIDFRGARPGALRLAVLMGIMPPVTFDEVVWEYTLNCVLVQKTETDAFRRVGLYQGVIEGKSNALQFATAAMACTHGTGTNARAEDPYGNTWEKMTITMV